MLSDIQAYRPLAPPRPSSPPRRKPHRKVGKASAYPVTKRPVDAQEEAQREPQAQVDRYA